MGTLSNNLDGSWLLRRRKDISYFSFSKIVDSDLCNFKNLIEKIVNQYPHSYLEVVRIFYYEDVKKCFPQVTTEHELLEMFSKHVDKKVIRMTPAYTDPTYVVPVLECYTPENSDVLDIPCTPSMACPLLATASQSNEPIYSQYSKPKTSQPAEHSTNERSTSEPSTNETNDAPDGDEYLANPEPQNEYMGIDDEGLYLAVHKTHVVEESDSTSDFKSDEEYEEEDDLVGKDPLPPVPFMAYDRDDPPMRAI
ncbi:hypothetical protein PAHAL_1G264300 [Panicum hallii]|uniref:Uncharacterized protein n=1 Tax=Panicum hallii TaxID=206008 RepID=A0A2T8KWD7_9POAL|nr:hypothetical protein PAHAL_1G264300 [Panicum hallii]